MLSALGTQEDKQCTRKSSLSWRLTHVGVEEALQLDGLCRGHGIPSEEQLCEVLLPNLARRGVAAPPVCCAHQAVDLLCHLLY